MCRIAPGHVQKTGAPDPGAHCLSMQTDAPYPKNIFLTKAKKTCLTVPRSALKIIPIVNISVRSRMALKSYGHIAPPSSCIFSHILMSFTDAAEAPKTRPPHL